MGVWDAFGERAHPLRMGLRPLAPDGWTDPPPPAVLGAELERKARLLTDRSAAVTARQAGCEAAAAELLERLTLHLLADHPGRYRREGAGVVVVDGATAVDTGAGDPLTVAARLVAGDVPAGVWVRSERQTLVPLPGSGWWVFGIETAQEPLTAIAGRPDVARRVRDVVTGLDAATAEYKGVAGWLPELTAWLDGVDRSVPPPSSSLSGDPAQQHE